MTPLHQMDGKGPHHLPKDLKELGELAHLLFEWPIRQAPRLAFPSCILLAAIIQAGTILLFSISYKAPSDIQPDSPQIYFIPPDSAAAKQIAPWLAANDPAVFSPQYDTRDALPAPPPLKYRPSYEESPPPLRPLPTEKNSPVEPPLLPQRTDILRKNTRRASPVPSATSRLTAPQTVVHWQDELGKRTLAKAQPLPTPQSSAAQPALYEVEVSAEGIPMHCLLLESSGDQATDESGSIWIHAQRFLPADQPSWGRVLLLWGAPVGATSSQSASPSSTARQQ
jgi:hypothetical protein